MPGKRKQRVCRICKKRPPWKYKNCPPGVCKKCYHRDIWPDRPAAREQRRAMSDLSDDRSLGNEPVTLAQEPEWTPPGESGWRP